MSLFSCGGILLLAATAAGLRPGLLARRVGGGVGAAEETLAVSRRQLLASVGAAVASTGLQNTLGATAAAPKAKRKPLRPDLVEILRVKESCGQETRLINTGKYRDLQRLSVKRAIGMMIDNSDLQSRFVSASSYAELSELQTAVEYGNTAVESLVQILEYFPDKLTANNLSPEQKTFVLAALSSASKNIDSFLTLMPATEVIAAAKQIEEENALNKKEYEEFVKEEYANPPKVS